MQRGYGYKSADIKMHTTNGSTISFHGFSDGRHSDGVVQQGFSVSIRKCTAQDTYVTWITKTDISDGAVNTVEVAGCDDVCSFTGCMDVDAADTVFTGLLSVTDTDGALKHTQLNSSRIFGCRCYTPQRPHRFSRLHR